MYIDDILQTPPLVVHTFVLISTKPVVSFSIVFGNNLNVAYTCTTDTPHSRSKFYHCRHNCLIAETSAYGSKMKTGMAIVDM